MIVTDECYYYQSSDLCFGTAIYSMSTSVFVWGRLGCEVFISWVPFTSCYPFLYGPYLSVISLLQDYTQCCKIFLVNCASSCHLENSTSYPLLTHILKTPSPPPPLYSLVQVPISCPLHILQYRKTLNKGVELIFLSEGFCKFNKKIQRLLFKKIFIDKCMYCSINNPAVKQYSQLAPIMWIPCYILNTS